MKKAQWQFTHRHDNQADIKRILREAREDGLTLVEVRGGPEEHRGVYIDAQFVGKHKEHWPKARDENAITIEDVLHPVDSDLDGWAGNWIAFAGDAKRAHEQFCKNLEAASKPREYPPTVSVRAAGPDLNPVLTIEPAQDPTKPYIPAVGDRFRAKGLKFGALYNTRQWPHRDIYCRIPNDSVGNQFIQVRQADGTTTYMTKEYYEFKKVQS